MKSTAAWVVAIVLILVVLLALPGVLRFAGLSGPWYGGMMGGRGMMGGYYGFFPLGFLGMGCMLLVPVALRVLVVAGIVAVVNSLNRGNSPASYPIAGNSRACPNCAKPAQPDWNTCPYCGTSLN